MRSEFQASTLKGRLARYGVAVGSVSAGLGIRALLGVLGTSVPYITLFPAVMLSSWFGGLGPGLLSTLLSLCAVAWFVLPPSGQLALTSTADLVGAGLFVCVSLFITALNQALRRARFHNEQRLSDLTEEIHKRRDAELALAKARAEAERDRDFLQTTLSGIADGVIATDAEGRITFLNAAARQFLAKAPAPDTPDLAGADIDQVLVLEHEHDRDRAGGPLQQLLGDGHFTSRDLAISTNHGRMLVELSAAHIRDQEERVAGAVLILRDVTEQKLSERALRRSEERLKLALDAGQIGVWDWDIATNRIEWSDLLFPMHGIRREEFGGRLEDFSRLIHPEDARRVHAAVETALRDGSQYQLQFRIVRPDGSTRWLSTSGLAVRDDKGEPTRMLGATLDITDRKAADDRERESEKRLLETARLESLGVMAGGIAHEFNNLLVGILGNASMLAEDRHSRHTAAARDIQLAAERAADLTRQMLAFSGKGRFVVKVLELGRFIRENLVLLRASLSRSVSVDLQLCEEDCCVEGDPGQLQQVIMNLLINASEAIGERPGKVIVRTSRIRRTASAFSPRTHAVVPAGSYVLLEVVDNGSGMAPETVARIFDPFFTTRFTGRGLGLAAVLGIVRGHEGDIEVDSRPGEGTAFRIYLPEASDEVESESLILSPDAHENAGRTVLVVDDEPIVLRFAAAALEVKGFTAETAGNGEDCLQKLRENPAIEAVVLDLTMPVMTGEQAIPLIRELRPGMPILLSSGFSEAEIATRFAAAGLAGFLQKPYSSYVLAARVSDVLKRQANGASQ